LPRRYVSRASLAKILVQAGWAPFLSIPAVILYTFDGVPRETLLLSTRALTMMGAGIAFPSPSSRPRSWCAWPMPISRNALRWENAQ
jgi:hypothetical protein